MQHLLFLVRLARVSVYNKVIISRRSQPLVDIPQDLGCCRRLSYYLGHFYLSYYLGIGELFNEMGTRITTHRDGVRACKWGFGFVRWRAPRFLRGLILTFLRKKFLCFYYKQFIRSLHTFTISIALLSFSCQYFSSQDDFHVSKSMLMAFK